MEISAMSNIYLEQLSNHFQNNKYLKWYNKIIQKSIDRNWSKVTAPVYVERHHILPDCLGGPNKKDNLVYLTAREHFVCHLCLAKCSIGKSRHKMWNAIWFMSHLEERYTKTNSRTYEVIKKNVSTENKKQKHTAEWKINKSKQMKEYRKTHPVIIYQHQKDLYAKLYSKRYIVTDPEGNSYEIENMSKFCRDNNLNKGNMCAIARGTYHRKDCKGWSCVEIKTSNP